MPLYYNYDEGVHMIFIQNLVPELQDCFRNQNCEGLVAPSGGGDAYRGRIYYIPQAAVQLLLPAGADALSRQYVARLPSLIFNVIIVALAYFTVRELFPSTRLLAIAAAGSAGLMPSFFDIMSGVNLDAPAALVGSLIVYTLARILSRGMTWGRIAALILEAGVGYTLKGTVWPLFIAIAFCFWLLLPRRLRIIAIMVAVLSILPLVVWMNPAWQGVANWFYPIARSVPGFLLPNRSNTSSVIGQYSLETTAQGGSQPLAQPVVQYLPDQDARRLREKVITFGVWVRASDEGATAPVMTCGDNAGQTAGEIQVSSSWQFYAGRTQIQRDAERLGCFLGLSSSGAPLLYDGMVAAEGEYPTDRAPVYFDADGHTGTWGGRPFVNLLENPSAEEVWPQVDPTVGYQFPLNQRIVSVLAWRRTWPSWLGLIRWSLVIFWSGWAGEWPGLSPTQMIPMAVITALALAGLAWVAARDLPRRLPPFGAKISRQGFWLLAVAGLAIAFLIVYRADIVPHRAVVFDFSSMRHASAGRIALTSLLAIGLLRWIPRRWQGPVVAIGLLALFGLHLHILLNVQYPFQHCSLLIGAQNCLSFVPFK